MTALFNLFASLVIALTIAAFSHFGVAVDDGPSARERAEPARSVKRTVPVPHHQGEALLVAVPR